MSKRFAVIFAGICLTAAGLIFAIINADFDLGVKFYYNKFMFFVIGVAVAIIGIAALSALNKTAYRFLCAGSIKNLTEGAAFMVLGFIPAADIAAIVKDQGWYFGWERMVVFLLFALIFAVGVVVVVKDVITRVKSVKKREVD